MIGRNDTVARAERDVCSAGLMFDKSTDVAPASVANRAKEAR